MTSKGTGSEKQTGLFFFFNVCNFIRTNEYKFAWPPLETLLELGEALPLAMVVAVVPAALVLCRSSTRKEPRTEAEE